MESVRQTILLHLWGKAPNMAKSIGIGITNRCNLRCPHCYSRSLKKLDLDLPQMEGILKRHPDVQEYELNLLIHLGYQTYIDFLVIRHILTLDIGQ